MNDYLFPCVEKIMDITAREICRRKPLVKKSVGEESFGLMATMLAQLGNVPIGILWNNIFKAKSNPKHTSDNSSYLMFDTLQLAAGLFIKQEGYEAVEIEGWLQG